jgi:hypothetical protein
LWKQLPGISGHISVGMDDDLMLPLTSLTRIAGLAIQYWIEQLQLMIHHVIKKTVSMSV